MSKTIKTWTPNEDQVLKQLVNESETLRWGVIARRLEVDFNIQGRTGKQCRERWTNNLNPAIKDEEWTAAEETVLFQMHAKLGNKWSIISKSLPGRTDNCVKNRFYSALRKAMRRINRFIPKHYKRAEARPFAATMLSKILFITENVDANTVTSPELLKKCQDVIEQLVHYAYDREDTLQEIQRQKKLVASIAQINKSYKKKKSKKKRRRTALDDESEEEDVSCTHRHPGQFSGTSSPTPSVLKPHSHDLDFTTRNPLCEREMMSPRPLEQNKLDIPQSPQILPAMLESHLPGMLPGCTQVLEASNNYLLNHSLQLSMPYFGGLDFSRSGPNQDAFNYFLGESKANF